MTQKFPKTLYVKEVKDNDVTYFSADAEVAALVETGEQIEVAEYRLVARHKARGIVSIDMKKRRGARK